MRMEKGNPGYIKAQKAKYLILALGEFAIVIALVVLGYVQTGTKLNWFTLFAVLGCLPASKMLVEYIAMRPHKSISPGMYREIEEKGKLLTKAYDMLFTCNGTIMPVTAVAVSSHLVCGYSESPKTDEVQCARYLKEMLKENKHEKMTVKLFHDYAAFLSRIEGMNHIASVEKAEDKKKERTVRGLLLAVSM